MKLNMYSIWDVKAEMFTTPMFLQNHQVAVRAVADAVRDPSSHLNRNPSDYFLFFVGVWDDADGSIVPQMEQLAPLASMVPVSVKA